MRVMDKAEPKSFSRSQYEQSTRILDLDCDLSQYDGEGWEVVAVSVLPHDPSRALFVFRRRRT